MLVLEKFIAKGATRECYEHPSHAHKCVKVGIRGNENDMFVRELETFAQLQADLHGYIVTYDMALADTDKGQGLVSELIRDDDGSVSRSLSDYLRAGIVDQEIIDGLNGFVKILFEKNLYFYDFNPKNFVVQKRDGKKKIRFIDLKSFQTTKFWTYLKLEHRVPLLARHIMARRLKRLYTRIGADFPSL